MLKDTFKNSFMFNFVLWGAVFLAGLYGDMSIRASPIQFMIVFSIIGVFCTFCWMPVSHLYLKTRYRKW